MSRFYTPSSPRRELGRAASAPYLAAAEQLHTARQHEFLSDCTPYGAVGCLALSLNLGEVVDSWEWGAQGGDREARGRLAFDICSAVLGQYKHVLVGLSSAPNRSQWCRVTWLHMVVRPGEEAQNWLVATAQAQAFTVEVQGRAVAVPARPVAARLPPGHVQVVFRGVPFYYARPGFTTAVLGAAAYSLEQGVVVVHERPGIVRGPSGESLEAPSLDVVVAVVRAPEGDPALQLLPAAFCLGQQVVQVEVEGCVEQGLHLSLRTEAPAAAAVGARREGVLTRVFEQHGITSAVLAAAPPLVADIVGLRAQRPGSQVGLGFAPAGDRGPQPRFVRGHPQGPPPPPPPRPAAEFPMPAAEPLLLPPLDEPVFGAAMEYILDCCDGVSEQDAQRVVMAVRQFHPEVYAASAGASGMGGLDPTFRLVLASQATGILGEDMAAMMRPVGGAGGEGHDGEEDEQGEGELGGGDEGSGSGRAVTACLPASVLAVLESDGEEAVGVHAMEDISHRGEALGMSVEGEGEPAVVPTPPITSQPSVARGKGQGKQRQGTQGALPPRPSPYPQRSGRMQGPSEYWIVGSPTSSRQQAGSKSLVQDVASRQHTPKPKAARSPAVMGSGCQRQ